jgi:hypothetical protein
MSQLKRKVGRYEILEPIGRGGMALVYLARQTDLDRDVALKELAAFHAANTALAERFVRESRVAGSLSHPNIVTVYDFFEHDGVPYICMEYVRRGSLRPFVGHMSLPQVVGVLEGVLAGLTHAEAAGIVHRDLKPENLMVTTDGRVKITDFGIAKAYNKVSETRFLTATGTTVGTPTYMAPEQAMAKDVGPWTDLYSVGVMAYEMLVGEVPFGDSDTPIAILLRHVNDPVPSPRSIKPDLDPQLADWIESLLVKNPHDRVRSAADAWDSLEEAVIDILGPRWRREARLLERARTADTPKPLTPAPFHEEAPGGKDQAGGDGQSGRDAAASARPAPDDSGGWVTFERKPGAGPAPPPAGGPAAPADEEAPPAPPPAEGSRRFVRRQTSESADVGEEGFLTFERGARAPAAQPSPEEKPPARFAPAEAPAEPAASPPSATGPTPDATASSADREAFVTFQPPRGRVDSPPPTVEPEAPAPPEHAPPAHPAREFTGGDRPVATPTGGSEAASVFDVEAAPQPEPEVAPEPQATIAPKRLRRPTDGAPAAVAGQAADSTSVPGRARRARSGPRVDGRVAAIAGALAVAAAGAGFLAARSTGRDTPTPAGGALQPAANAELALRFPSSWRQVEAAPAIPGLAFRAPIVLAPTAGPATERLVAGQVTEAGGPTLLPPSFLERLGDPPPRDQAVRLGRVVAYRYAGLEPEGTLQRLTLYVAPTTGGVATVACVSGSRPSPGFLAECERVATTLQVRGAEPVELGPSQSYADALDRVMRRLNSRRATGRAQLRAARTADGQGRTAAGIARAYADAVRALKAAPAGPAVRDTHARVVAAMTRTQRGYERIAASAGDGERGRYNAGVRAATQGEKALARALRELESAGYSIV